MRPGTLVAERFEIEHLAGAGGMGRVYSAVDLRSGRRVALKVLTNLGAQDDERFGREIETLARLEHPGIVHYVAHGRVDSGEPFLAMEWVDGRSLSDRIGDGPLGVEEALAMTLAIGEALSVAHAQGVVHRDIKPSNLHLVGGDPRRPKVLDFGTARLAERRNLTAIGMIIGTPGFMSPEQARGEGQIDARTDVFALGCVLFEALTAQPAFTGATVMAVLAKIVLEDAARVTDLRPDVPEAVEDLIDRMLSKDRRRRPSDGAALAAELREIIGPLSRLASPIITPRRVAVAGVGSGEMRLLSVLLAGPDFDAEGAGAVAIALEPWGATVQLLAGGSLLATLEGVDVATDLVARAARSALAIRALAPGASVAVATGRGLGSERGPIGETADRAATLLSERRDRPAGAVLDELTAGLLDVRFVTELVDGRTLLLEEGEAPEKPRALLGQSTPFVGRDDELASILQLAEDAGGGSGARAAIVLGAAGFGKSRLRLELLAHLRAHDPPFEVLQGRGDSVAVGSSFAPLAQMVRAACSVRDGEPLAIRQHRVRMRVASRVPMAARMRVAEFLSELIGAPLSDEGSPALRSARRDALLLGNQIRRALLDWLSAETDAAPVALVLEDLQWGDLPTVNLVDAALRELAGRPLLVLAFGRPEVMTRFADLWSEHGPARVDLGPLDAVAIRALARVALGRELTPATVRRIAERSEGNAFFVEELLRAEAAGQRASSPDTVLAMLHARLEALPAEPRRVLRAASVFGERFWTGGVRALVGGGTLQESVGSSLHELAERELVVPRGEGRFAGDQEWSFRHALVRESAYGMLPDADRTRAHLLAAMWLEGAGERDPLILAEHLERGGDLARAPLMYRRAAEHALEGNDFDAALRRAARGLECLPPEPTSVGADAWRQTAGVLRRLQAEAHGWRGELAEAEARGGDAMLLLPAGDPDWYRAAGEVASAAGPQGHRAILVELFHALANAAGDRAPEAEEIAAAARLARQLLFAGLGEEARGLVARLATVAPELVAKDPVVAGRIQYTRALLALFSADPGAYLRRCESALVSFEAAGDVRNSCATRSFVGFARLEVGRNAQAAEALRHALGQAEHLGLGNIAAHARHNLGLALARLGALEEARAVEEQAVLELSRQGDRRLEGGARIYLSMIRLLAGDLVAAEVEAQRAVASLAETASMRPYALACLARILVAQDRVDHAFPLAAEAAQALEEHGDVEEGESLIRLVWAEVLSAAGDVEAAKAARARARARVMERAAGISDAELRESFLTGIPDNARTLGEA